MKWCPSLHGLACAISAALFGCGGGGGGGEPGTIAVSFTPAGIDLTLLERWTNYSVNVRAQLSAVPTGPTYVYALDPGGVLVPGELTVRDNGDGSFTARLPIKNGLAPASYSGNFTLRICKDPGCAAEYALSGATIPYTLNILAQVTTTATATISIDGVVQSGTGGTLDETGARVYAVTMPTGHSLEIDTAVNVETWSFYSSAPFATVAVLAIEPSMFRATVTLSSALDPTEATSIQALSGDGQLFHFGVTVTH